MTTLLAIKSFLSLKSHRDVRLLFCIKNEQWIFFLACFISCTHSPIRVVLGLLSDTLAVKSLFTLTSLYIQGLDPFPKACFKMKQRGHLSML